MSDTKHLWEVRHPYYCNEEQYSTSQYDLKTVFNFKTFEDFLDEWGDADLDYNLVFRWDWEEDRDPEDDEDEVHADAKPVGVDVRERNGTLKVFFMMQRKGYHSSCIIRVCRADEPAVREFLEPRMKHLLALWTPLVPVSASE